MSLPRGTWPASWGAQPAQRRGGFRGGAFTGAAARCALAVAQTRGAGRRWGPGLGQGRGLCITGLSGPGSTSFVKGDLLRENWAETQQANFNET